MTTIPPLAPRPEVLDFLATRRSRPAKTLRAPAPDRAALEPLLALAARVPDHGKLEPWRFVVLEGAAPARLGALADRHGAVRGLDEEGRAKVRAMFEGAPSMVAVVSAPVDSPKIPRAEQEASAACACLMLVTAATAAGWGANWLTGWTATDGPFLSEALGLSEGEAVAGWIVLGTEGPVPPERPRPDMEAKVDWVAS